MPLHFFLQLKITNVLSIVKFKLDLSIWNGTRERDFSVCARLGNIIRKTITQKKLATNDCQASSASKLSLIFTTKVWGVPHLNSYCVTRRRATHKVLYVQEAYAIRNVYELYQLKRKKKTMTWVNKLWAHLLSPKKPNNEEGGKKVNYETCINSTWQAVKVLYYLWNEHARST